MKLLAAVAISVSILMAQNDRPGQRTVTAVRHWSLSDVTRVAVEVSGDFEFRNDRLHNPERVYFDILNARPQIESKRIFGKELDDKLVMRVRAAETLPGVTRIVLDLAAPVEVITSKLTNPNRLMIELRAPTGTAPMREGPTSPAIPPATLPPTPASPMPAVIKPEPARVTAPPMPKPVKAEPAPAEDLPPSVAPSPDPPPNIGLVEIGKAARHTSTGHSSLTRALGLKVGRVVIDPGHGGRDQGTESPHGLLEKDLVLDVALRIGKLIEDRMNAEVIYTRTDDTFVPLEGRTGLANEKRADLFLSIHANSSAIPRIAGMETFYLNFSDSREALDVAGRENATSQKSIFELQDIIQKITLHDKLEESREFASRVQSALFAFSAHNIPGQKNRGVKKAPFVVLIGANMPSVLAEIGFLSNSREELLLKKPDYRQKLAEALYRGISKYAESLSHFQMAQN
jgi:N-acetylmuramoyl-L-alanine amidase